MLPGLLDATNARVALSHVLGVVAVIAFIALSAWTVVAQGHPFDPLGFGPGLAAVLAGAGGMDRLIKRPEPDTTTAEGER